MSGIELYDACKLVLRENRIGSRSGCSFEMNPMRSFLCLLRACSTLKFDIIELLSFMLTSPLFPLISLRLSRCRIDGKILR